ncbi:MAG: hypothetical protein HOO96_29890 [Polyangiaceae bacterium]|nr:hypothetical protein [Polyangiaceae bacterium]
MKTLLFRSLGPALLLFAPWLAHCSDAAPAVGTGGPGDGGEVVDGGAGGDAAEVPLVDHAIAENLSRVVALAATDDALYAAVGPTLRRYDLKTNEVSTLWSTDASYSPEVSGVEILGETLYATDRSTVHAMDLAGGSGKNLLAMTHYMGNQKSNVTWHLGASGAYRFAYDEANLVRFAADGTGTPTRSKITNFFYLLPAGGNLWLVSHFDDYTIRVVPASSPTTTFLSFDASDTGNVKEHGDKLAANTKYVYSAETAGQTSKLVRYDNPTRAGAPVRKTLGTLDGPPERMVADEQNLFVGTQTSLTRYSLDGAEPKVLVARGAPSPLAVNKDYVFWVEYGSGTGTDKIRATPR